MHTYEVEIKTLLGAKENADKLKERLRGIDPAFKQTAKGSQLNHYFNLPADLASLYKAVEPIIEEDKKALLRQIIHDGKKISVRTRKTDHKVILVIKASVGDDTSANGVSRIEFESPVTLSLDALDQLLIDAGLTYQAKWSRDREEYQSGAIAICIDRNAGYGYLAEFERVARDGEDIKQIEKELRDFMSRVGVEELQQDRLERMFAHYNTHWREYYGTDKVFTIE